MQEWMLSFVNNFGYFGIFLLIFIENVFPPHPFGGGSSVRRRADRHNRHECPLDDYSRNCRIAVRRHRAVCAGADFFRRNG